MKYAQDTFLQTQCNCALSLIFQLNGINGNKVDLFTTTQATVCVVEKFTYSMGGIQPPNSPSAYATGLSVNRHCKDH